MSNLAEVKELKAQLAALHEKVAAFEASALQHIAIPAATISLALGERYAGLILDDDGQPSYHLVLLPEEAEGMTFEAAGEWVKSHGGELPNRREQSLLYANLKGEFQDAWYWSCEHHSGYSDFAWVQDFGNGGQYYTHKSDEYRCRAVRRLAI